jgi:soluble cytochrome b562
MFEKKGSEKMKKITSLILAITFFISGNIAVYGVETNQSTDRSGFVDQYLNKMQTIVELRVETETARNENNTLVKEIKESNNNASRTSIEQKVTQIKQINQTNKDLLAQAKTYGVQRTDLRKQWQNAIKERDTDKSATVKNQITELTGKIEEIRTTIKANRELIVPLTSEVKAYRDGNKALIEQVKPLLTQTKTIQTKIANEIIAKDKLWENFSTYVKEKNYDQAAIIMDSIISAKQTILVDIKSKNTNLNEILTLQKK